VIGILLALYHRERSGRGQHIDIAITDGMLALMPVALLMQQLLGTPPERGNAMLSHRYACYNTYTTRDGRYIAVGCVEARFWEALCGFLDLPDYIPLQYDEDRREEIIAALAARFQTQTMAEWEAAIGERDVCCSGVRRLDEALTDDAFVQRGMVQSIPGADGVPVLTIGTPVQLSATPGGVRSRPVGFGENTVSILKALGYSDQAIGQLGQKGVI
jgi:crotonobetainyl-CoA:carnitine CoA-transferase CaiB-like acyl-CoA transferase